MGGRLFWIWNRRGFLGVSSSAELKLGRRPIMEDQLIGKMLCPECWGTGKKSDGAPCPGCEGTGVVLVFPPPVGES